MDKIYIDNITVIVNNNFKDDEVILEVLLPSPEIVDDEFSGNSKTMFLKIYIDEGHGEEYVKEHWDMGYKLIDVLRNDIKFIESREEDE